MLQDCRVDSSTSMECQTPQVDIPHTFLGAVQSRTKRSDDNHQSQARYEVDGESLAFYVGFLLVFGDAERGASGSDDSEVQPPAAVQGRAAEVGDFAIVHYGSDVHLGEIVEVDREPNEYRVVFFNSFRAGKVTHSDMKRAKQLLG